jgi:hypothetical protein
MAARFRSVWRGTVIGLDVLFMRIYGVSRRRDWRCEGLGLALWRGEKHGLSGALMSRFNLACRYDNPGKEIGWLCMVVFSRMRHDLHSLVAVFSSGVHMYGLVFPMYSHEGRKKHCVSEESRTDLPFKL